MCKLPVRHVCRIFGRGAVHRHALRCRELWPCWLLNRRGRDLRSLRCGLLQRQVRCLGMLCMPCGYVVCRHRQLGMHALFGWHSLQWYGRYLSRYLRGMHRRLLQHLSRSRGVHALRGWLGIGRPRRQLLEHVHRLRRGHVRCHRRRHLLRMLARLLFRPWRLFVHELRGWHLRGGWQRAVLHSVSCRHQYDRHGDRQHIRFCVYDMCARLYRCCFGRWYCCCYRLLLVRCRFLFYGQQLHPMPPGHIQLWRRIRVCFLPGGRDVFCVRHARLPASLELRADLAPSGHARVCRAEQHPLLSLGIAGRGPRRLSAGGRGCFLCGRPHGRRQRCAAPRGRRIRLCCA